MARVVTTLSEAVGNGWSPPALAQTPAKTPAPAPRATPQADAEQERRKGYDTGYAEGLAAGRAQGESIAAEMTTLLQAMAAPFQDSEAAVLRELLDLVEKAVSAVLDRELQSADYDLEKLLRESLEVLGSVNRDVELTLNPADAAITRDLGLAPDVTLIEDSRMHRGGLRLRAGHRLVDASVAARLQAVLAGLRERAGVPEAPDTADGGGSTSGPGGAP